MKPINNDNLFGTHGYPFSDNPNLLIRGPFVNRPVKGKTKRKKLFPPKGNKTNIGDPMKGQSSNGKRK